MPASWATSSAAATWATTSITSAGGSVRRSRRICHSDVPSTYCITMYGAGSPPEVSSP